MYQHEDSGHQGSDQPTSVTGRCPDPSGAYRAIAGYGGVSGLLSLQALAGNRAVGRLASLSVQRAPASTVDTPTTTPPLPTAAPTTPAISLDDPAFNPTTRAHDLLRAIDSAEHSIRYKYAKSGIGFGSMRLEEDVAAERREINFPEVVRALDNLTPSQVRKVEEIYFGFEKKTQLRDDLFGAGQSGRSAGLTQDQKDRLVMLLRGTKPEPIPPEVLAELNKLPPEEAEKRMADLRHAAEAGPTAHRHDADAVELHELLSAELNVERRERVMALHRRPVAEIKAIYACYDMRYGTGQIDIEVDKRLTGLQRMRLEQLRLGRIPQADACAIEDKRRRIEAINKKLAEVPEFYAKATAALGNDPLAGVRKERQELTGEIQAIIELNKREALADPANAGRDAGQAVAGRIGEILNMQHGEVGHTFGDELTRTLGQDAAAITSAGATDPWSAAGTTNLVHAAAEQLAADERAGTTSAKKIIETVRSFRELAQHNLTAKAYDPAVSMTDKQAILSNREGAIAKLAQQYINEYRERYDKIAAGKGRSYEQIVASADDADERLIGNLAAGGGETSDWVELNHAMAKKDIDAVKTILRRQPNKEKIDELVARYNHAYDRDLRKDLFGSSIFGGHAASPEQAQAVMKVGFKPGLVADRDAAQVAELLGKPSAAELAGRDAEAKWIAQGGQTEYDVTMAHRGWTGKLREAGDVPETQLLLERTRDDLAALGKQFEAERDPVKRDRLLLEMRRLRATLTGDADAYEKDNAQVLAKIQSGLSFAVSLALAFAIPGAGPGLVAFLQTTAVNIAASVAANFVIKMGDYGLADLKADVLSGALSAGGAKFGEELMGRVAAAIVRPAAEATIDTAGKLGVPAALSKEVGSLAAAGERTVIKAEEFALEAAAREAAAITREGGTVAAAASKTFVETAGRETGGFFGGIMVPKILTGDYSLTVDEVLKALATTAAGKIAGKLREGGGTKSDSDTSRVSPDAPAVPSEQAAAGGGPASAHDHWVGQMSRLEIKPLTGPPAGEPLRPGESSRHTDPQQAYRAYEGFLRRPGDAEVAVYHNAKTGEYAVQVGTSSEVAPPKGSDWDAVVHFHPNPDNKMTQRMPAPADVAGALQVAQARKAPVTEFVEYTIPGVGRGSTQYTVSPDGRVSTLYVRPNGERVQQDFPDLASYQRMHGSRTTYVEPGSREHADMIADAEAANSGTQRPAGTRTAGGTATPPTSDATTPAGTAGKSELPPVSPEALQNVVDAHRRVAESRSKLQKANADLAAQEKILRDARIRSEAAEKNRTRDPAKADAEHARRELAEERFNELDGEVHTLTNEYHKALRGHERAKLEADPLGSRLSLPCFAGDTEVWTTTGPVRIDSLAAGTQVLSYDLFLNEVVVQRVVRVLRNRTLRFHEIMTAGVAIRATGQHRFWVEDAVRWVTAAELRPGMKLRMPDGELTAIDSVRALDERDEETWNLTIEDTPHYFVGPGVLVHNEGPFNTGMGGVHSIYIGTNPDWPGYVYVGRTDDVDVRQKDHRDEAKKALKTGLDRNGNPLTKERRDYYAFKAGMTLEAKLSGLTRDAAIWLEQHNIDLEQKKGNKLINLRDEMDTSAKDVKQRLMDDPKVKAAGYCQ